MSFATAELSQSAFPASANNFINKTTVIGGNHWHGPASEKILLNPESSQDISEFYNVNNELDFLDRYGSKLTQEEKFFYLVENQLKFLGEFVGELKFSKIRYLLNERNGFNFAGLRMTEMLGHTTRLAGNHSREGYENEGLVKLFNGFETDFFSGKNEFERGLILSPPKDWAYAFAFFYEKRFDPFLNGYVVDMYPLRYQEQRNSLTESEKLLRSLPGNQQIQQTTEGYLSTPISEAVPSLQEMLKLTSVSAADVLQAEKFQGLMEAKLGAEIALYSRNLINLQERKSLMSDADYAREFHFLEKLRRSIFHQAKELWSQKTETGNLQLPADLASSHSIIDRFAISNNQPVIDISRMNYYADQGPATITGGGSCPVPQTSTSNSSLAEKLENGRSIESVTRQKSLTSKSSESETCSGCGRPVGQYFHCPRCHGDASGPIGEGGCPHCSLTKETAAKEGYAVC
jgi:hypothetical protein